jgi:hypothetical protein
MDVQPIDLDDLQRVAVKVREKTDDNWLADMVEIACDEIARLREERMWVPVGERLPELNDANRFRFDCLVCCKGGKVCEMVYEINTYAKHERHRKPKWKWQGMISMWEVTHWMPLPPGPEGDG